MNTTLLLLLLLPVFLPIIARFIAGTNNLPWRAVAIMAAVSVSIVFGGFYLGRGLKTDDVEIWNGEVTDKKSEHVSCSHSYTCNCITSCSGSGSSQSCSTICQTCYEHSYDVDWNVYSTAGEFSIDRIDRQGVDQPPRWTIVQKGQPVALNHVYTNYVKAVPESLFHKQSTSENAKFASLIPEYPINIYDYQYADRVLAVGVNVPDLQQWNSELALALRQLGPQKQANVVVVIVKTDDPNYAYALRDAWLNGKKNDILVIIGSTEYPKIGWVRVLSWTDVELFKVQLRDDILDLQTADRTKVVGLISQHTLKSFKRKHMSEFQYLEAEIDPPEWVLWTITLLLVAGNLGFSGWIRYNEGQNRSLYSRRFR